MTTDAPVVDWSITREQDVIRWALEREVIAPIDNAQDFGRDAHVIIWNTILRLRAQGRATDYLTVRDELDRRGQLERVNAVYLYELSRDSVRPSEAARVSAAEDIQRMARGRRIRALLSRHVNADALDLDRLTAELQTLTRDERRALPPLDTLRDRLARPVVPAFYRIPNWQPRESRVLLAAQYKAGKTTLIGNLVRTLADGDHWLGRDAVDPADGSVVLLDFEMSPTQLDGWLRAQRIRHDDQVRVLPLRGRASSFDILTPLTRAKWAELLRACQTSYLILDCLRPVLDALGLDEHREAGRFLVAFDALLAEAGVPDACVVHHMGHSAERSRGDSRLRDWPDTEWRLMRKDEDPSSPRFITAYGRDVDVPESQLVYDTLTRRLTIETGSRRDAAAREALDAVLAVLDTANESLSGRGIKDALADSELARDTIDAALKYGLRTDALKAEQGPRNARLYRRNQPVSGSVRECPADTVNECPGAYISPDTRTLATSSECEHDVRTLDRTGDVNGDDFFRA